MNKEQTKKEVEEKTAELIKARADGNTDKAFLLAQEIIKLMADAIRAKKAGTLN